MRLLLAFVVLMPLLGPVAAAAQAATPVTVSPTRGTPENDQFYLPPSPLPPGNPGALIRWEPMPAPAGVRAWRILYHSTALDGSDVAVSGTVFSPDRPAPTGGFPLVAMGHNTTGLARVCAPSLDPFQPLPGASEAFYEQQVAGFVDGGFAVAATDYQGLGVLDGLHPFLVGETAGFNVLDAVRAARALPDLALDPETILWGHSQGGHAAAWAAQLAPAYAPELPISGVILGAPAVDPALVLAAAIGQLVVQGTADPLVPAAATEALVQRLCQLGATVQLRLYPDVGHGAVIAAAMPDMLTWAAARQQGDPAPSSCI